MPDPSDQIAEDLAFGAATGAVLIVGDAPRPIVLAAAASATVLALVGDHEGIAAELEDLLPPPVVVAEDPAAIPEGHYGALVLWELQGDVTATLERALAVTADTAPVHAVLRPPDRGVGGRWRRLIDASCDRAVASELEDGQLVVAGTRRAPTPDDRTVEVEPLPFTVVVCVEADASGLERTLVDVLLRPGYPPEEVFVVDASGDAPDDLWGFAAAAVARTVLVDARGTSFAEAVNDVLGGVTSEEVALIASGERLAANHVAGLAMSLGAMPDAGAAVAASAWTEHGPPAGPMVRAQVLRDLQGLDPEAGDPMQDLWDRLEAAHDVVVHPAPLARPSMG